MASRTTILGATLLLAAGLSAACFDGAETRGLSCTSNDQCGIGLACLEGWCGGVFICDDGQELAAAHACDQIFDCPTHEDELNCFPTTCTSNADCGQDYKCAWGSCAPLLGSVPLGGACQLLEWFGDDCDADTACYEGVCVTDCQSWVDCGIGRVCDPNTQLCESGCDPLANNCPDGTGCQWFAPDFYCADGSAAIGEPCDENNFCITGVCVVGSGYAGCPSAGCCAPFCELASQAPCEPPNGVCYMVESLEGYGVCAA